MGIEDFIWMIAPFLIVIIAIGFVLTQKRRTNLDSVLKKELEEAKQLQEKYTFNMRYENNNTVCFYNYHLYLGSTSTFISVYTDKDKCNQSKYEIGKYYPINLLSKLVYEIKFHKDYSYKTISSNQAIQIIESYELEQAKQVIREYDRKNNLQFINEI